MDKGNNKEWLMALSMLHWAIDLQYNYIMYPGTYVLEVMGYLSQVKVLYYSF
jgi:hypothetical protein